MLKVHMLSVLDPYFPYVLGDMLGVDRDREQLEWLIHIWCYYHLHT